MNSSSPNTLLHIYYSLCHIWWPTTLSYPLFAAVCDHKYLIKTIYFVYRLKWSSFTLTHIHLGSHSSRPTFTSAHSHASSTWIYFKQDKLDGDHFACSHINNAPTKWQGINLQFICYCLIYRIKNYNF